MITPVRIREFKVIHRLSHGETSGSVIGLCTEGNVVAKPINRGQLIREVLCNLLAQELDIPAPACFVLTQTSVPAGQSNPQQLWFGTTQQGQDYQRAFRSNVIHPPNLHTWPYFMDAIAFDAWIANEDRTLQNLLFLKKNQFALIDHGEALPDGGTQPDSHCRNLLAKHALQSSPSVNRLDFARRIRSKASRFRDADFSRIVLAALADGWGGNPEFIELCKLLQKRLEHLPELIEAQLETGQSSLHFGGSQ